MSFGGFIFGAFIMLVGFLAVYKTTWFEQNMGDLGTVVGVHDKPWLSWKVFGLVMLMLGFLIAFGLLSLFFEITIGRLFFFGRQ